MTGVVSSPNGRPPPKTLGSIQMSDEPFIRPPPTLGVARHEDKPLPQPCRMQTHLLPV